MANWQDPSTPVIWLCAFLIMTVALFGFVLLVVKKYYTNLRISYQEKASLQLNYQKNLLQTSIEVQENERRRIASDLHDDLISELYRLKLRVDEDWMEKSLNSCISLARNISHDLSPPLIENMPMHILLENIVNPLRNKFHVSLIIRGNKQSRIHQNVKLHVFRICQEILTNTIKHANARSIILRICYSTKEAKVLIIDDGVGFDQLNKNLGIRNVEMRSQLFSGCYHFRSIKKKGTSFLLTFPMNN